MRKIRMKVFWFILYNELLCGCDPVWPAKKSCPLVLYTVSEVKLMIFFIIGGLFLVDHLGC